MHDWPKYWTWAGLQTYSLWTPFSSNEEWKLNNSLKPNHKSVAKLTFWIIFNTHHIHTAFIHHWNVVSSGSWLAAHDLQTRVQLYVDTNTSGMERRINGTMTIYGHGGHVSLYQIKCEGKISTELIKSAWSLNLCEALVLTYQLFQRPL